MKKFTMLMVAVVLVLSSSVTFAGFSSSPSGDASEKMVLTSTVDGSRTFQFLVICAGESITEEVVMTPNAPQTVYYQGQCGDKDQTWQVIVLDMWGHNVATGIFRYHNGEFVAGTFGEGLTFSADGSSFTLTNSK